MRNKITFFEAVQEGAVSGTGYGLLVASAMVGSACCATLFILAATDNRCLQYTVIMSMYDAFNAAVVIPGGGMILGATHAALRYGLEPDYEENGVLQQRP